MQQLFRFIGNVVAPLSLLVALIHCGGSDLVLPAEPPGTPPPPNARIQLLAGDEQSGVVGGMLELPLAVRVTNSKDEPVEGVTVRWAAANGGTVSAPPSTPGSDGIARVLRMLGPAPGPYATRGEATGVSGSPVLFQATAIPVPP